MYLNLPRAQPGYFHQLWCALTDFQGDQTQVSNKLVPQNTDPKWASDPLDRPKVGL